MESVKILDNLHLFNCYNEIIDLSFNQYVLHGSEPILIHTGSKEQAVAMLPKLKALLGGRQLEYIFISHFESDECGGLNFLMEYFPHAKPICSQVTARQLSGFGWTNDIIVKAPGDVWETSELKLRFISYPSEMHLWEGLLVFEENSGLIFSSDLFIHRGRIETPIIDANWKDEIEKISLQQIPSPTALKTLQEALADLPVKYVIPGHGPCLRV